MALVKYEAAQYSDVLAIEIADNDTKTLKIRLITDKGKWASLIVNRPKYLRIEVNGEVNRAVSNNATVYGDIENAIATNYIFIDGFIHKGNKVEVDTSVKVAHGIEGQRAKILKINGNIDTLKISISHTRAETVIFGRVGAIGVDSCLNVKGNVLSGKAGTKILCSKTEQDIKNSLAFKLFNRKEAY